jgi:hypothetical protein
MDNNGLDFSPSGVVELQLIAGGMLFPITPQTFNWQLNNGAQESYAQLISVAKSVFGGDGSLSFAGMGGVWKDMHSFTVSLASYYTFRAFAICPSHWPTGSHPAVTLCCVKLESSRCAFPLVLPWRAV